MILVFNAGSSSLKYKLFNMETKAALAAGVIERIGEQRALHTHQTFINNKETTNTRQGFIKDHGSAMNRAADMLVDADHGVLDTFSRINAIGHRVVQGGESFGAAALVDDEVIKAIKAHIPLAPLHNPANLIGIETAGELFPGLPNVAVFDTQFHHSMPPMAFRYAIPSRYYTEHRVRRYGFHGTSHKYVSEQACALMEKKMDATNLITIHLGNGCSVSAVKNGQSVDTSMGMTPLAGVMMGTRSGDIDPAILPYLARQENMDTAAIESILNHQSGMQGICGKSDMRDIHAAALKGDKDAVLAIDIFCYQIKKYIGSYSAILGHVDAIVFTAGIGENDAIIRKECCKNLAVLGIRMDRKKNKQNTTGPFSFHAADSAVQLWVVPTNEELQIAKETQNVLSGM